VKRRAWIATVAPPIVVFILATLLVQALVDWSWLSPRKVPPPTAVLHILFGDVALWESAGATATAASLGFLLSGSAGIVIAIALSSSKWVERAFYPYAIFFQTVPVVAIAPLLVIWLDYGMPAVIASAFIVSVFPVIANTLTGLHSTDPALRDLFRLYSARPFATLWKLKLPSAVPYILTGLRIAAGLAVIGTVVGEFVGGGGIGIYIQTAMRAQAPEKVFAAVLIASFLGLALVELLDWLGSAGTRHGSES
jgi:NitT/TauT family transport system permease protein